MKKTESTENRSFTERRKFTYTCYAPERRSGIDRRVNRNQTDPLNEKAAETTPHVI